MKTKGLFFTFTNFLLLSLPMPCEAQNTVFLSVDGGYFTHHSDNLLPNSDEKVLDWSWGGSTGFELPFKKNICIKYSLGYFQSNSITHQQNFSEYFSVKGDIIGNTSVILKQQSYPLDITLTRSRASGHSYGLGPTIVGTSRAIIYEDVEGDVIFKDRIAILGLGVYCFRFRPHYNGYKRFGLYESLSLRYIKSVWCYGPGRDLSNYHSDFLQIQLSIGIARRI